ncbi:unnamed protein product [Sympodiomycopsis kandeliae]
MSQTSHFTYHQQLQLHQLQQQQQQYFQPSSEVSYFEDNEDPPQKPVRRGAGGLRSAKSSRVEPPKPSTRTMTQQRKKINAVSKASLATFHPGYHMGMDADMEPSWSQSSAGSSSTIDAWSPVDSTISLDHQQDQYVVSPQCQTSPTPELEAFLHRDLQTALMETSRGSTDDSHGVWSAHGGHRRGATMASVFEDDADADVSSPTKAGHSRRVAFKIRSTSTDSTKSFSPSKSAKALPTASPLSRFFNWRKAGKHANKFDHGDNSVPSSAPANVTTFAESMRSPGLEPDFGSEGRGGGADSLPNTPLNHTVQLPSSPGIMPHRRPGPPPRSILRKQSAPSLRNPQSSNEIPTQRSFEAPASFSSRNDGNSKRRQPPTALTGLSSHSSSEMVSSPSAERVYSTVGRGVARDRSSSFSSIGSASSNQKSPKRKNVNKRFENMPSSPLPHEGSLHLYSPPTQPMRLTGNSTPTLVPSNSRPILPQLPSTTSMAQQVADGLLNNSRGFEEPTRRVQPQEKDLLSVQRPNAPKSLRRRSRSVGAIEVQDTFAAAVSAFANDRLRVQTELAPSRVIGLGRGQARTLDPREASHLTPTQRSVPTFAAPQQTAPASSGTDLAPPPLSPRHKMAASSSDSGSSSDSDSGHSAEVHTVQARKVQLVNTRVKATTVSSPSLASVTRSPRADGYPSSPQPSLSNSSPLLTAPRALTNTMPATPQRNQDQHRDRPLASPGSTLSVTDDSNSSLPADWSQRASYLLSDGLSGLDISGATEGTLDFGFPSCPSVAPLNIRPRARLASNFSEASDVSLSSSVGTLVSEVSETESENDSNKRPHSHTQQSPFSPASSNHVAQRTLAPQTATFGSNGSMDSSASGSLPSLTSSDSEASNPPLSRPGGLTVTSSASSTSLSSITTTNTSILDYGMPQEEARRYVHQAKLSEDAFTYTKDARTMSVEDQSTPTLSSGAFRPAINVIGPDVNDNKSRPQLTLDFEPGGSLGLSLGSLGGQGRRGSSASSRRSSRTVTPTQEMFRSASPNHREARKAALQESSAGAGLGLGLGFGLSFEQPASPAEQPVMQLAPYVGMGEKADMGAEDWEASRFKMNGRSDYDLTHVPDAAYEQSQEYNAYDQPEWEMGVAM